MSRVPILTIAVPTYNMEKYLPRNLKSIAHTSREVQKELEVLVLDNSSSDESGYIAENYAKEYPRLFTVIHKENKGYGSSVNMAIEKAKGQYLRIVDADDWVDPEELAKLVTQLKGQLVDLVLMPYRKVDMKTGKETLHCDAPEVWKVGEKQTSFDEETCSVPQLHGTVFRVEFLRQARIRLLENAYYVDEQMMIWAYMSAASACRIETDVYRYRVGNEAQSISARNMGVHWNDRERVIRSCLERQRGLKAKGMLRRSCMRQLSNNVGNHFTTLYMCVMPRKYGRNLACAWREFVQENIPEMWQAVKKKAWLLSVCSFFCVPLAWYERVKSSSALRKMIRIS